jgi:hypothetical protein
LDNSGTDSLSGKVSFKTYIGIFFIALSTLMYEILLTRIFSVTMGYHFAFMAVSLAMFGMTAGAVIVYLYPQKFPQDNIKNVLAKHSLYFAVFIIIFLVSSGSLRGELLSRCKVSLHSNNQSGIGHYDISA